MERFRSGFFLALLLIFGCVPVFAENDKIIVLTFDDGPRPDVLRELLPVLEKHGARGTFFVIGATLASVSNGGDKYLLEKMLASGHEIENHSWGHENFKKLFENKGAFGVINSLNRTGGLIFSVSGRKPLFFRPPFWEIGSKIKNIIVGQGYAIMEINNPDINTLDYDDFAKRRSASVLAERVKRIIAERERNKKFVHILVFHELPITVNAFKDLIPDLQNKGYKFLRLDETDWLKTK